MSGPCSCGSGLSRSCRIRGAASGAARVQPLLPRLAATDFPERSPMSFRLRTLLPVLFGALLAAPAVAQDEYVVDLSRIDPSAILASAGHVLIDRKSVVEGKSVSVRVDLGGGR